MKISDFLKQEDNDVITIQPMTLTINKLEYDSKTLIEDVEENQIWVKSLLSTAEYQNKIFNIVLDYPVILYTTHILENSKSTIKLKYIANDIVLEAASDTGDNSVEIAYVERLIGGRELYKDATHLYRKIYNIYGALSDMDSIHIEVLCAQILRDKKNVNIPARLGKTWDPVLINMKKVIYSEGFIQGLAFEDLGQALRTGLISKERLEPSILERVLTGELAEERKK